MGQGLLSILYNYLLEAIDVIEHPHRVCTTLALVHAPSTLLYTRISSLCRETSDTDTICFLPLSPFSLAFL